MAGYYGWSMSNNAVDAYDNGERPLSKWTKAEILEIAEEKIYEFGLNFTVNDLKKVSAKVLKKYLLHQTSWHHTGSWYNRTDFYSFDESFFEQVSIEDIKEWAKIKSVKKEKDEGYKCRCSFLVWSGSKNHPHAKRYEEDGIIRGNWFYRDDGSKKSISANGFIIVKKY